MIDRDTLGRRPAQGWAVELRDGVAMDEGTRTVETHVKGQRAKNTT